MYQVTAIFDDCEVGYGEGDSDSERGLAFALEECLESVDSFYRPVMCELSFRVVGGRFPATLDLHSARAIINS